MLIVSELNELDETHFLKVILLFGEIIWDDSTAAEWKQNTFHGAVSAVNKSLTHYNFMFLCTTVKCELKLNQLKWMYLFAIIAR